jgi:tetratricopeptide (TPR) repeat protein
VEYALKFNRLGDFMIINGLFGYYIAYFFLSGIVFLVFRRKFQEMDASSLLLFLLAVMIGGAVPFAVTYLGTLSAFALLTICSVLIAGRLTILSEKNKRETANAIEVAKMPVRIVPTEPQADIIKNMAAEEDREEVIASREDVQSEIDLFVAEIHKQTAAAQEELLPADELLLMKEGLPQETPELTEKALSVTDDNLLPSEDLFVENQPETANEVRHVVTSSDQEDEIIYRFYEEIEKVKEIEIEKQEYAFYPELEQDEDETIRYQLEEHEEKEEFVPIISESSFTLKSLEQKKKPALSEEDRKLVQLHFMAATEAIQQCRYDTAISELRQALQYQIPVLSRMVITAEYVRILQELGLYQKGIKEWKKALELLSLSATCPVENHQFKMEIEYHIKYIEIVTDMLRQYGKPNLPWSLVPLHIRQEADECMAKWKSSPI